MIDPFKSMKLFSYIDEFGLVVEKAFDVKVSKSLKGLEPWVLNQDIG
jgi:hypothetical protein